jgi:hypothetical protein
MDAVRRSAHLYGFPNDSSGYGIPDFSIAEEILSLDAKAPSDFIRTVYPNPFQGNVTISYYVSNSEDVVISLYDVLGRTIAEEKVKSDASTLNKKTVYSVRPLPEGIYFISLKTSSGTFITPIIRD